MREYASPAAFRAAVDTRLRNYARKVGIPVQVVRRQAALERLMARLAQDAPRRWALKGGFALDTRLGQNARPSMGIDHVEGAAAAREDLQRASALDLNDHFAFSIIGTEQVVEGDERLAVRYRMEASLAGVPFEVVQIDVTATAPEHWQVESAQRTGLLAGVGLGPIEVMLVPLERQVAEKLHAYTRRDNGASTRVRDLVDFVVICLFAKVKAKGLGEEITRTFAGRDTHAAPDKLPAPPADWARSYREQAQAIGIPGALNARSARTGGGKAGDLLGVRTTPRTTNVQGIQFRTSELREFRDQARALATGAAREKAEAMAAELGMEIGRAYQRP